MNRTARKSVGLWRLLRNVATPVRRILSGSNVLGAVHFAVIWFVSLALVFQISLAAVSTAANASQSNALALSAICGSVDQQSPSDSHDRVVAGHLKCIACVIGHSLAPPSLAMALQPARTFAGFSYTSPFSVPAPYAALHYSHSARGPPATA
jgi:hypothetical protein